MHPTSNTDANSSSGRHVHVACLVLYEPADEDALEGLEHQYATVQVPWHFNADDRASLNSNGFDRASGASGDSDSEGSGNEGGRGPAASVLETLSGTAASVLGAASGEDKKKATNRKVKL